MKYFDKAVYLFVFYIFPISWVFGQTGRNLALKLRGNVVHLNASFKEQASKTGFGFVIGEKRDTLYITTAWHVVIDKISVENNNPKELEVRFYQLDQTFQGKVLRFDDKKDIAIISVKKPEDYQWKKKCVDKHPKEGGKAYYIGKGDAWTVPTEGVGGIKKIDEIENIITAENLNIAPGSSGAPLLGRKGIVGMILQDERNPMAVGDPVAVGLKTIKNIATKDGQYPYVYSLPPSKFTTKTLMISGLGVLGGTGVILGVQQINEAKNLHDYYDQNRDAISSKYPYEGLSRSDLYDEADDKYKAGQAFIIGGGVALGAAAWLLIKDRIIKQKNKSLSRLSINPQVYWADGYHSMGAKGIQIDYTF